MSSIDECYTIARRLDSRFFALQQNICAIQDGFTVSPGLSNGCLPCPKEQNYLMTCGGPGSFSLYSSLDVTYIGIFDLPDLPDSNTSIDMLEHVPSGYPSLQHCYWKAANFGYKYFLVANGINCSASNDPNTLRKLRIQGVNDSSVVTNCENGDPCGGPGTAAMYSLDSKPPNPDPGSSPSSSSLSTMDCFNDSRCRAVLSAVFGIVGVVLMLCCAGLSIALKDGWIAGRSDASISDQGDRDLFISGQINSLESDESQENHFVV